MSDSVATKPTPVSQGSQDPRRPNLDKYFLKSIGDSLAIPLERASNNAVAAQVVSGAGRLRVDISLDWGYSWVSVPLTRFDTEQAVDALEEGQAGWAYVPGATKARAVLVGEDPNGDRVKVNLRYAQA